MDGAIPDSGSAQPPVQPPIPPTVPIWSSPSGLPPTPALRQVEFVSEASRFVKMLCRGAALSLVTFGFYRFWLATDIRRHLWSHSLIDGENAEYTGTGRELLIGFLFALAIIVPIYLVYFLIGIEAERLQAFASVPLGLFMVLFGSFATYRARRYRLTRTIWRGVRFWMQGSGWKYAFLAFGWSILVVLTLGAVYPWRAAALERYKMGHTHYGDLQGSFDGKPGAFFRMGLGLWLYFVAIVLLLIGGAIAGAARADAAAATAAGIGGVGALALPFMYPIFKAREWRWWASGVSFGGTRLSCDLRGGSLLGLYVKLIFISSLITSIAAMLLFGIGLSIASLIGFDPAKINPKDFEDMMASGAWVIIAFGALGYLIVLMIGAIVQRFFLQHEYWRLISGTMTVINPVAMEDVAAKGDLAHALGEGLADGLDIAGF